MGGASERLSATPGANSPARPGADLGERMPSLPFLWWAIGLGLVGGFGLGMALFLALAFGLPIGAWWLAAVQAHGHVQLYGWGGMFALGIGLYFLPRLRGSPPLSPRLLRSAATLMGVGLALRGLCQPLARPLEPGGLRWLFDAWLLLSGLLELAGAGLAVWALVTSARRGPPLNARAGLLAVVPFALTFFVTLLVGLALNAVGLVIAIQTPPAMPMMVVRSDHDWIIVHLGLNGMLVAISAAVACLGWNLWRTVRGS